jgi:hypothetical protein
MMASVSPCWETPVRVRRRRPLRVASGRDAPSMVENA